MGITSKTIAPFVAAAFSVEGEYSEFEKEVVAGLANKRAVNDLGDFLDFDDFVTSHCPKDQDGESHACSIRR